MSSFSWLSLLNTMIQKEPGVIVGPITQVLGFIINFIFNIISNLSLANSLGFSIILLTIVARFIMLPLAFKQQKSMQAMQRLQPEVDKIKKKYGDSKDPEIQQKMNAEIQTLWSKNKVNPFSGCLPLFIQFPIFFALSYLFQQTFIFVSSIGTLYNKISTEIIAHSGYLDLMIPIAKSKVPNNMTIDISILSDMNKVINKLTTLEWNKILDTINSPTLNQLYLEKTQIEHFFGINLVDMAGTTWPGILIPILAAATTFLSSYLMNKQNKSADKNAKMQQQIMLIFMPLMMGWFTISMPAGVGLYWTTTNVFQLFQQLIMNKQADAPKNEESAAGGPGNEKNRKNR